MTEVWCKSGKVPIAVGVYSLNDGTLVTVKRSKFGKFYACGPRGYQRGLIYRLRAELEQR